MRRTKLTPITSGSQPTIEEPRKTLEAFRIERKKIKKPVAIQDETVIPDGLYAESVIRYQPFKLDMDLKDTVVKVRQSENIERAVKKVNGL